ncbi:MAG: type II toxin-antitoxin system HicA family toxin [Rivularia sp. ALOHA_DT_140]|nr:type II toxin-antitoxin system HicA family toxin [Rivularia sp. ALOHA_DT_140]
MGKLRVLSAKEVCKILEQNGFIQVRQRGSHIIMQLEAEDSTVTVPVPNYNELKTGTLRSIIRQSGLSRTLFEVK